ncbi:MAG: LysM peptidoglycan-binding domain-containing protein [Victivallales bacterium]|nr:LysM peptidoglycan-binding domain-containing protein [Victivallales bacterium]
MNKLFHGIILFFVLAGFCGCSFRNADENSHPLFIRAEKARKANEFELAAQYYNRYLGINPESSKTHLLLASLYDENLDLPLSAVYHYQRFLELAPNSPEAGNVEKWLAAAKKKYYNRARLEYNDPEDVAVLQNKLFIAGQELKKCKFNLEKQQILQQQLVVYARKLKDSDQGLKLELARLNTAHEKTLSELQTVRQECKRLQRKQETETVKAEERSGTGPEPEKKANDTGSGNKAESVPGKETGTEKPAAAAAEKSGLPETTETQVADAVKPAADGTEKPLTAAPVSGPETAAGRKGEPPPFRLNTGAAGTTADTATEKMDGERVYTVMKGDSLSSISRSFYGSSRYYKFIFDANRDVLPDETSLRPGQVLKIPVRKNK